MSDIEVRVAGGLEILGNLERLGAATPTSLDLPLHTTYDQYEAIGFALGRAHRNISWKIADWLNFGEHQYGHKYEQAAEVLNMNPDTLRNYASIGRRVPVERRRAELPFGSHAEVAKLEPHEQAEWLERAVEKRWRRDELRAHIRPQVITPALPEPMGDVEGTARHVVRSAIRMGDGFLVREQAFTELAAALGEPT